MSRPADAPPAGGPRAPRPAGIDPRGPRFAAAITATLLAVAVFLALLGTSTDPAAGLAARLGDPAFVLLAVLAVLFAWGAGAPGSAPWGVLFRRLIRPRLDPPTDLEDPRPPRFAQAVGLVVVGIGLLLHGAGVPYALPVAAAAAFLAAFLNAAFALCLGCELYLLLTRAGILRTS
ncbi:DUF4395 domain-containing protein [Brachybacterium phenoliresistens]|uniref:DUF4395 domain-containing protein n=1 Tax=Brachybacterium phenoliresistens TaxID=396014 RepID=UPI0031D8AD5F